jgi:hypothetical protein
VGLLFLLGHRGKQMSYLDVVKKVNNDLEIARSTLRSIESKALEEIKDLPSVYKYFVEIENNSIFYKKLEFFCYGIVMGIFISYLICVI